MSKIVVGLLAAGLVAMTGVYAYHSLSDGHCPLTGHEIQPVQTATGECGGCCPSMSRGCAVSACADASQCDKTDAPKTEAVVDAADAPK